MGQSTGRSRAVRRITGTAAVIGLLAACTASSGDAGVRTPSRASLEAVRQAACQPSVSFLRTRVATELSAATAINDDGWVAGWVAEDVLRAGRAMLWRDNGPPLDLGVRGVPYDINEDGAIAINGDGFGSGTNDSARHPPEPTRHVGPHHKL